LISNLHFLKSGKVHTCRVFQNQVTYIYFVLQYVHRLCKIIFWILNLVVKVETNDQFRLYKYQYIGIYNILVVSISCTVLVNITIYCFIPIVCSSWDFTYEIVITSVINIVEEKFLYWCEASKMAYTVKQKALLLELLWEKYEVLKFSNTFPIEKPFNYNPLNLN